MLQRRTRKPLTPSRSQTLATALSLAPSGSFVYGGFTDRISWDPLTQGVTSDGHLIQLSPVLDFYTVITSAIARVNAMVTATVHSEPRFWIRSATCKTVVTSRCQTGMDVWFYPSIARYDVSGEGVWEATNAVFYETAAGSTSTSPSVQNIGWTPFQSRAITQSWKLMKPRRVHLEAGQSFTYTMRDLKPLYITPGRLGLLIGTDIVPFSIAGRTKSCYIVARGTVVNDDTVDTAVGLSAGALDIQEIRTYDWVATSTPYHFNDNITNTADVELGAYSIIQPQTGVVTTHPAQGI